MSRWEQRQDGTGATTARTRRRRRKGAAVPPYLAPVLPGTVRFDPSLRTAAESRPAS